MDYQTFINLQHKYYKDNYFLSFHNYDDDSYRQLKEVSKETIPWLSDLLKEEKKNDYGGIVDTWLCIQLLHDATNCLNNLPEKYRGRLDKIVNFILKQKLS